MKGYDGECPCCRSPFANLEQMQPPVNRLDEPNAFGEQVKGADAAVSDGAVAFADFVMDVAGPEDGRVRKSRHALAATSLLKPPPKSLLASIQLPSYLGSYSKLLFRSCDKVSLLLLNDSETEAVSSFLIFRKDFASMASLV